MSDQPRVESYWRLAWQWVEEKRQPHARWRSCPCLACSDLRRYAKAEPLPIRIGSFRTPALATEPEPLMKRRTG